MNEEKIIKLYSKEYCILINKSWFGNVTDVSIIKVKIYLLDLKINLKITNLIKLSCFRTRVQMSFWKTNRGKQSDKAILIPTLFWNQKILS